MDVREPQQDQQQDDTGTNQSGGSAAGSANQEQQVVVNDDTNRDEDNAAATGNDEETANPPPDLPLGKDDPGRMDFTEDERQWALDIKDTIEGIPELDNLSDYMYMHLALIDEDNIEKAVERAYKLQLFREEYGVIDTPDDGRRHIARFIRLMPRHVLSFTFQDGNYIFITDWKHFDAKALNTPEKIDTLMCSTYYLENCFCCDLEAIRQGIVGMNECEGYQMACAGDRNIYARFWNELASIYPIRYKKLKHFHTGMFINLLYSMLKRFLTPDIRKIIEVGCDFDGRLDEIYLTPTVEAANQRVLQNVNEALDKRYRNERNFTLEPPPTESTEDGVEKDADEKEP